MRKVEALKKNEAARKAVEPTAEQKAFINKYNEYRNPQFGNAISPYIYAWAKGKSRVIELLQKSNVYTSPNARSNKDVYYTDVTGKALYEAIGKPFMEMYEEAKKAGVIIPNAKKGIFETAPACKKDFNLPAAIYIGKVRNMADSYSKGYHGTDNADYFTNAINKALETLDSKQLNDISKLSYNINGLEREADLFLQTHLRNNIRRLAKRIA